MKFLDKIAMNRLIKIIGDFILAIIKMFPTKETITKPKKNRPILDKLRDLIK